MNVKTGEFVAEYIDPIEDKQIQPNGVDLRVTEVYQMLDVAKFRPDDYEEELCGVVKPTRKSMGLSGNQGVYLERGVYIVAYKEKIKIPQNCVGVVFPRSSLMRCGSMLNTALWDAGYEGIGEGRLHVGQDLWIYPNVRIGQIVFFEADKPEETYNGQYQGENLDG